MAFRTITRFEHLFTKELGNFKKIVKKAENDEVYVIETWKNLDFKLNKEELVSCEYLSKDRLKIVLEKD